MKVFIALMFLLTSVNANAGAFATCSSPDFSEINNKCESSYNDGRDLCIKAVAAIDKIKMQAIQPTQTTDLPNTGGVVNYADLQKKALANMDSVTKTTIANCQTAYDSCKSACGASYSANESNGRTVDAQGGSGLQSCQAELKGNAKVADSFRKKCQVEFGEPLAKAYMTDAATAGQLVKTQETKAAALTGDPNTPPEGESWFQRNGAWVVGAGLVGVGAMALLSNSGSKSGQQQQQQNSPSPSPSPTNTTGGTGTTCANDADYATADCASAFVSRCVGTVASSAGCQTFANHYCGFADNATSTPSGSGTGNKTTFCRTATTARFCADTSKSICSSCEYQAQLAKPICATNPTLCVAQNTPEQVAAKKAACPSDPVYADYSILPGIPTPNNSLDTPNLPTGTTSTVVATPSPTGSGVYTGKYYSSNTSGSGMGTASVGNANSAAKPGVTTASPARAVASTGSSEVLAGGYGSYATASLYKGAPSEISASMGRNLFDKNSKTMQTWCSSVQCRNVGAASN